VAGPAWLSDIFAGLMLAVAVYCVSRLVAIRMLRKTTEVDTEVAHIVMGVAMAGVFAASLHILPAGIWEAVFGVAAAWFAWRVVRPRRAAQHDPWRCPHPLPHLVECGAMLYMFAALPAVAVTARAGGMGGMGVSATESRFSILALGMTVFMLGYAVWVGNRIPALAATGTGTGTGTTSGGCPPYLAPRCAALCKMAMGVTMGYMLILML